MPFGEVTDYAIDTSCAIIRPQTRGGRLWTTDGNRRMKIDAYDGNRQGRRSAVYNDESRRRDLLKKITAAMKRADLETLEDVYAQVRRR